MIKVHIAPLSWNEYPSLSWESFYSRDIRVTTISLEIIGVSDRVLVTWSRLSRVISDGMGDLDPVARSYDSDGSTSFGFSIPTSSSLVWLIEVVEVDLGLVN